MENIKFLSAENEIQKIYSNLGLIVPVGDLSTGKAPAVQPLPSTSTQDSITFNFNVMSSAEITRIGYRVNNGNIVEVTPQKGVVSITLEELEHNSGPYEIELTVFNETGRTSVTQTAYLQPFTDWATANEVLEGNKFIGEDGQEHVGTLVPASPLRIGHVTSWSYSGPIEIEGVTYNTGYFLTGIGEDPEPDLYIANYEELIEYFAEHDYVMLGQGDPCGGFLDIDTEVFPNYDAYDENEDYEMVMITNSVECDPCEQMGCNGEEQSAEQ